MISDKEDHMSKKHTPICANCGMDAPPGESLCTDCERKLQLKEKAVSPSKEGAVGNQSLQLSLW